MAASEPQQAAPADSSTTATVTHGPAAASGGGYYIEFRVAQIGTYGHSYVAYGQLNARGQPVGTRYADLHPTGGYAVMALGHILPVPANTTWDPDVLKLPVSSSYRRRLNAAEYQRLMAALARARANKQPYWNAVTYNCNNFVADLAQSVGLKAPSTLLNAYAFVPALRDMNESAASSEPGQPRRMRAPAAAGQSPRS